jgi:hypothetical protein
MTNAVAIPSHITLTMASAESSISFWESIAYNPTFIGVIVTAILGVFGVWVANIITGSLKDQELFLKACDFLNTDSGTKSRAIGIGVLKTYAEIGSRRRKRKDAVAIIFRAQMFHLAKNGHNKPPYANQIEAFNYFAMKNILEEWGSGVPTLVEKAASVVEAEQPGIPE